MQILIPTSHNLEVEAYSLLHAKLGLQTQLLYINILTNN